MIEKEVYKSISLHTVSIINELVNIKNALSLIVCLPDDIRIPINNSIAQLNISRRELSSALRKVAEDMSAFSKYGEDLLKEIIEHEEKAKECLRKAEELIHD